MKCHPVTALMLCLSDSGEDGRLFHGIHDVGRIASGALVYPGFMLFTSFLGACLMVDWLKSLNTGKQGYRELHNYLPPVGNMCFYATCQLFFKHKVLYYINMLKDKLKI